LKQWGTITYNIQSMTFIQVSRFAYACSLLKIILYYMRNWDSKKKPVLFFIHILTGLTYVIFWSCEFVYTHVLIKSILCGFRRIKKSTEKFMFSMRIVLLCCLLLFLYYVYWSLVKHADEGAIARLQAKKQLYNMYYLIIIVIHI
jgi:hypothetical protein